MKSIKLKEGQIILDENGKEYQTEKGDMIQEGRKSKESMKESYSISSLGKEMEKLTLKMYNNFNDGPEWKVKKTREGLEIHIEPNNFKGEELDIQDFVDLVVEKTGFGGYQNGYGGWLLSSNYVSDDYDYGNKSSRSHY